MKKTHTHKTKVKKKSKKQTTILHDHHNKVAFGLMHKGKYIHQSKKEPDPNFIFCVCILYQEQVPVLDIKSTPTSRQCSIKIISICSILLVYHLWILHILSSILAMTNFFFSNYCFLKTAISILLCLKMHLSLKIHLSIKMHLSWYLRKYN